MATFDLEKLRLERANVEVAYHQTYTFYGLKGVLAERWGHGPIFGAVGEAGSGQINLQPTKEDDERLVAVEGIRTSALLAEGDKWGPRGLEIAREWLHDVYEVLKPQRTVSFRVDLLGLYPIREPEAPTRRLIETYYKEPALRKLLGSDGGLAAVEAFAHDETPNRTIVLGAVGPPHHRGYFTFPNADRDKQWWMGVRIVYSLYEDSGIDDPIAQLDDACANASAELVRISRFELPGVVGGS